MNKIAEFLEIFDIVINNDNEQKILCGSVLASALFEHKEFEPANVQYKNFISPFYHGGMPYVVGYINNAVIYVDPEFYYDNMCIYTNKGKLIYSFEKFGVKDLI